MRISETIIEVEKRECAIEEAIKKLKRLSEQCYKLETGVDLILARRSHGIRDYLVLTKTGLVIAGGVVLGKTEVRDFKEAVVNYDIDLKKLQRILSQLEGVTL